MTTDLENYIDSNVVCKNSKTGILKRTGRFCFSFTIAFILFFSSVAKSQIVINEVGIAPVGGDGFHFIELFNRAACTIDLSCYTVVYNSDTGSGWTIKIPNGTTIASGGYYLIGGVAGTGGVGVGTGYPNGGTSSPYSGTGTVNLDLGNAAVFNNTTWMLNSNPREDLQIPAARLLY